MSQLPESRHEGGRSRGQDGQDGRERGRAGPRQPVRGSHALLGVRVGLEGHRAAW